MTELHPLVWAHATRGFDTSVRVRSLERFARVGLTEGLNVLKSVFAAYLSAGLRSDDRRAPFPEEVNRRFISCSADLHFPLCS